MSNLLNAGTRDRHRRTSSKRRCLSELQASRLTSVFESVAIPFPNFGDNVLLEKDYKGKIFRNRPQCYLEIFTYNYLVMCFQSKNGDNCQGLLDDIYELIEKPQFQFIFPSSSNLLKQQYSAMSLKNIISQYLNYMSSGTSRVLDSLNKYPPVLCIFVAFFRTLLVLGQLCTSDEEQLGMEETFQFLSSYFDLEMKLGNNYVHFEESNIYVYQKDSREVYMFYPIDEDEVSSFLNNIDEELYKSGYTSLNLIMSKLDESEVSQILAKMKPKNEKQEKAKGTTTPTTTKLKKSSRLNVYHGGSQKKKIREEFNQQSSKISYNYTESSKTINPPGHGSNKINVGIGMNQNKKSVAVQENNGIREKKNQGMREGREVREVGKNQMESSMVKHKRHASQSGSCEVGQQMIGYYKQYLQQKQRQSMNLHKTTQISVSFPKKYSGLPVTSKVLYQIPNSSKSGEQLSEKLEYIWVNNDVTQEFTSSFILETMPQPYRSSIKAKKQKARLIRRSACTIYS